MSVRVEEFGRLDSATKEAILAEVADLGRFETITAEQADL
jgi:hypothetical protein